MADLKQDLVPAHPLAAVHIISTLKDMQKWDVVNEFWQWARHQGPHITDARSYGAMIEALAYQGVPLSELESLYAEAFDRYSQIEPEIAKESGATRIMLLQGIITARLLYGEWQSAYEAFDLILRLYPTATPARVYELFIYERPVEEGFIVFLMACRAGVPPNPGVLTPLLKEIWLKHKDVKAMLKMVWAYVGAGGRPTFHHLNSLIKALLLSYPLKPQDTSKVAKQEYDEGWRTMMDLVRQCIQSFVRLGINVEPSTFNTIITCGGKLGKGELVVLGLKDMLAARLTPSDVTYRTLVVAAGQLGDKDQLEAAWAMLAANRIEKRGRLERQKNILRSRASLYTGPEQHQSTKVRGTSDWDAEDWLALINAGVQLGKSDFVSAELEKYRDELGVPYYSLIWNWLANAQSKHLEESRKKMLKGLWKGRNGIHEKNKVGTNGKVMEEVDSAIKKFDYTMAFKPESEQLPVKEDDNRIEDQTNPITPSVPAGELPTPDHSIHRSLYPEIERLRRIFSHPVIQDYCPSSSKHISLDFDLSSPQFPPLPDAELQSIYNELVAVNNDYSQQNLFYYSVDSDAATSPSPGIATISPTGFTLRELRFENWKSINKLLFEAECDENRRIERIRRQQEGLGDGGRIHPSGSRLGMKFRFWKEEAIKKEISRVKSKSVGSFREGRLLDDGGEAGGLEEVHGDGSKGWKKEEWRMRKIVGGGGVEITDGGKGGAVIPGQNEDVTEYQDMDSNHAEHFKGVSRVS